MNRLVIFAIGCFVGGIISIIMTLSSYVDSPLYKKIMDINDMIAECEKNLPRTQTCILVAKPKRMRNERG